MFGRNPKPQPAQDGVSPADLYSMTLQNSTAESFLRAQMAMKLVEHYGHRVIHGMACSTGPGLVGPDGDGKWKDDQQDEAVLPQASDMLEPNEFAAYSNALKFLSKYFGA